MTVTWGRGNMNLAEIERGVMCAVLGGGLIAIAFQGMGKSVEHIPFLPAEIYFYKYDA